MKKKGLGLKLAPWFFLTMLMAGVVWMAYPTFVVWEAEESISLIKKDIPRGYRISEKYVREEIISDSEQVENILALKSLWEKTLKTEKNLLECKKMSWYKRDDCSSDLVLEINDLIDDHEEIGEKFKGYAIRYLNIKNKKNMRM